MEATPESKLERKLTIEEVNAIIKETFGKGFTGNNMMHGGDITEGILSEWGCLGWIGTKGFGESQMFNRVAGYFGRGGRRNTGLEDGSVITIAPRYAVQAIKYAKEYEALTGKRVQINLWE